MATVRYSVESLKQMAERLRALPDPPKAPRNLDRREAVVFLSREIAALKKRGFTLAQIVESLRGVGLDISTPTLKSYLQRAKPGAKPAAPKKAGKKVDSQVGPDPADSPAGPDVPSGTFAVKPDTQDI